MKNGVTLRSRELTLRPAKKRRNYLLELSFRIWRNSLSDEYISQYICLHMKKYILYIGQTFDRITDAQRQ